MLPRECDNDECEPVTRTDGDGVPRLRWDHVPGCTDRTLPALPAPEVVPKGSFLAYLGNWP